MDVSVAAKGEIQHRMELLLRSAVALDIGKRWIAISFFLPGSDPWLVLKESPGDLKLRKASYAPYSHSQPDDLEP